MNYAAIDWQVEAQRIAIAFAIESEYAFVPLVHHGMRLCKPAPPAGFRDALRKRWRGSGIHWWFTPKRQAGFYETTARKLLQNFITGREIYEEPICHNRLFLQVDYYPFGRRFQIADTDGNMSEVAFAWDFRIMHAGGHPKTNALLAQGLFHLDLLTPDLERALQGTVSAHQRLEWALEFENRQNATPT